MASISEDMVNLLFFFALLLVVILHPTKEKGAHSIRCHNFKNYNYGKRKTTKGGNTTKG